VDNALLSQRNIRESTSVAEGGSLWVYNSSNGASTMQTASFFSDAGALGMRNGDILIAGAYSTQGSSSHRVVIGMIAFDSTTAASLSTAGTITSTVA